MLIYPRPETLVSLPTYLMYKSKENDKSNILPLLFCTHKHYEYRIIYFKMNRSFHKNQIRCILPFIQNTYGICLESLQTVQQVPSCPKNLKEWNRRADMMKCSTVIQSCGKRRDFVYHCLPNSFWNKTVEVCALRHQIILCE